MGSRVVTSSFQTPEGRFIRGKNPNKHSGWPTSSKQDARNHDESDSRSVRPARLALVETNEEAHNRSHDESKSEEVEARDVLADGPADDGIKVELVNETLSTIQNYSNQNLLGAGGRRQRLLRAS